ncbi:MAG: hypothetical protein P3B76_10400 [Gemmatimonadota bacterium]|nr:hypothetical protein [Gemmatimonadota bacterium]MDQ8168710.1 hypothetical protein [Gemmatimonadota bacterium]MDQ8173080.1 hypothetical protein [Gemmatimonadota bacterium]
MSTRAPSVWHWVSAGLVVSLAGVGYDAVRAHPSRTLPEALRPYAASFAQGSHKQPSAQPARPPAVQAAVLLQLRDCSGNLRMLHLLHRGPTRARLRLAVMWYVGPLADSTAIRSALPAWTSMIPLRPAPRHVVQQFAALGHTSTPALLVLDLEGRVRLATQSPRSSREVAGLRRIIEGLTWIEEL